MQLALLERVSGPRASRAVFGSCLICSRLQKSAPLVQSRRRQRRANHAHTHRAILPRHCQARRANSAAQLPPRCSAKRPSWSARYSQRSTAMSADPGAEGHVSCGLAARPVSASLSSLRPSAPVRPPSLPPRPAGRGQPRHRSTFVARRTSSRHTAQPRSAARGTETGSKSRRSAGRPRARRSAEGEKSGAGEEGERCGQSGGKDQPQHRCSGSSSSEGSRTATER